MCAAAGPETCCLKVKQGHKKDFDAELDRLPERASSAESALLQDVESGQRI